MSDFKEIVSAEFISITGGLMAGLILSFMLDKIYLVPGLFILIPGFLEMRGSLSGSLAARISSGLFLGVVKPRFSDMIVKSNIIATVFLVILSSVILGVFAYISSSYFFGIENVEIIFVSIIAGFVSLLMTPVTVFTTMWLFRHGHDPNNIMGPYITTLGDLMSVVAFIIAIWAVG